ncbi:MAG TPA: hypothetical protein VMT03_03840 [Polyangia bacterium]|nr:hypothetical protein [Polyangia bacterium]
MSDSAGFPKMSEVMMAILENGVEFLEGPATRGYLAKPIPNALDGEIGQLVSRFREISKPERQVALALLRPAHASVLRCYAERMASLSVRLHSSEPASRGVLSLGLASRVERDVREIWLVMAVVFDAIQRCGDNAIAAFKEVAGLLPEDIAGEFEGFTQRSDLDKIAAVMGYVDSTAEDGFRYKRTF